MKIIHRTNHTVLKCLICSGVLSQFDISTNHSSMQQNEKVV